MGASEQEPIPFPFAPEADQVVSPLQPLPVKGEDDHIVGPLLKLVQTLVPDLDRARSVLTRGNLALELPVFQRVVGNLDGEVADPGCLRNPLRDRPALEDPVALEPEVVVQRPRRCFWTTNLGRLI